MVSVLLDTCVISEIRRMGGDPRVRAAVDAYASFELYFSVITIGEITKGLVLLAPGRKRSALEEWVQEIESEHSDRILPINLEIARLWGAQTAKNILDGSPVADADGLIAATAQYHQLPVMTRNVRHFLQTGVRIINPWQD
jgi:predicted nucleic acid-binding protein